MKAALIVMTILGCDDSVSQCHYIETANGSWQTVAACDAQSESRLPGYTKNNYPVIVAVCETAGGPEVADSDGDAPTVQSVPQTVPTISQTGSQTRALQMTPKAEEPPASLPRRALALVRGALPDLTKLRQAVSGRIDKLETGYSWVVRKFTP